MFLRREEEVSGNYCGGYLAVVVLFFLVIVALLCNLCENQVRDLTFDIFTYLEIIDGTSDVIRPGVTDSFQTFLLALSTTCI